jgi:hypothetical protein
VTITSSETRQLVPFREQIPPNGHSGSTPERGQEAP